jgi:hypothetical protein
VALPLNYLGVFHEQWSPLVRDGLSKCQGLFRHFKSTHMSIAITVEGRVCFALSKQDDEGAFHEQWWALVRDCFSTCQGRSGNKEAIRHHLQWQGANMLFGHRVIATC